MMNVVRLTCLSIDMGWMLDKSYKKPLLICYITEAFSFSTFLYYASTSDH